MRDDRYIYDALYGPIRFPQYVWEILVAPELQRLREVRLCNINSLCLTGGANVNRYEHVVGTTYLALQCANAWPNQLPTAKVRFLALAALLHDTGTAPFGHSVQYVLEKQGYRHESLAQLVGEQSTESEFRYQHTRLESVFFGMPKRLGAMISAAELNALSEAIEGHGEFGPLISGSVDLDNIDNVYRLAYHIGLVRPGDSPLELGRSFYTNDGKLVLRHEAISLLEEWCETRRLLYHYLLLNPDEFAGKCMLEEALLLANSRSSVSFAWHDVDSELLAKLRTAGPEVSAIVARLMIGDLYGCIGIYSTSFLDCYDDLMEVQRRAELVLALNGVLRKVHSRFKSAEVAIHLIKDVNKTERRIEVDTDRGDRAVVGESSRRVLIGVFFKNGSLSMNRLDEKLLQKSDVTAIVGQTISAHLGGYEVSQIPLYDECYVHA